VTKIRIVTVPFHLLMKQSVRAVSKYYDGDGGYDNMPMLDDKPTFSFSAWALYSHCPYKYNKEKILGYTQQLVDEQLRKGGAVHYNLYRYASDRAAGLDVRADSPTIEKYAQEWAKNQASDELGLSLLPMEMDDFVQDSINQTAHDSIDITIRTLKFFDLSGYDIVVIDGKPAIEYEFFSPFDNGDAYRYFGAFHGLIDLIVRNRSTGEVFIVDYKTTKTIKSSEAEDVRIQLGLYQYAIQRMGIRIDGTITVQIHSKPLSVPKLLKAGGMSRAYILTTWENYAAHLERAGLNPDDYAEEMIPKLATAKFFELTIVHRNEAELKALWYEVLLPVMHEISDLLNYKKSFRRHLNSFLCPSCSMKEICLGELRGQDMSWTLQNHFKQRSATVEAESISEELEV
jgi:CRISPR/Cas system-associated exonuclease Cas4 (RecB family)